MLIYCAQRSPHAVSFAKGMYSVFMRVSFRYNNLTIGNRFICFFSGKSYFSYI